jgi:hypothetical protein
MRTALKILPIVLTVIAVTAAQAQTYYHYECADGASFEVAFYPATKAVFLQIDGKSLQLPKRFSLTSQRVSFALKSGGTATIRRAGGTSQCKAN